MILYVTGDLFQSPAQVLVNTVNTVGVMGKGIALDFKKLYPEMFRQYRELCEQGRLQIGTFYLYKSKNKWVLNFPTKKHWRNPSKIEYIKAGLEKFVESYSEMGIHSIAFPALGCGNGQLDFKTQVQPLMHNYLKHLPIEIFIYPGQPSPFVEHLNVKEMREWLRTEPTNLPFLEVWDDLKNLLKDRHQFFTQKKQHPFTATIEDSPQRIVVESSGSIYSIEYEVLTAFWQQLRSYGFSMRKIAPGLGRELSYLTAIFAELEYVSPVQVTEDFRNYRKSVIGLQVLPKAFQQASPSETTLLSQPLLPLEF